MKKNYKYLLWDVDDTLIDFKRSEKMALQMCFNKFDVTLSDEDIQVYSKINHTYWGLLEQGKIEKSIMLNRRFEDFTNYLSIGEIDCAEINAMYQVMLGDCAVMIKDAYEVFTHFNSTKKQYALTNGTAVAQHKKLTKTGLLELFDGIFISDEVGYEKPDVRFFQQVFEAIPDFNPDDTLMIGDSLSSDILGANNAGIDCCWFNHRGNVNSNSSIKVNYEIHSLNELFEIIS